MHCAFPLLVVLGLARGQTGEVTIPITSQPTNFSGAAGIYRMEVHATPTTVRVEDPITLTIKLFSLQSGPVQHRPHREKLRLFPAEMDRDFYIEPVPEDDRFLAGENAWEFTWRLIPKHQDIHWIPALSFVYYHTSPPTGFKAADGSQSIALDVKPRQALMLSAPAATRERFMHILEGNAVLTRSSSARQRTTTIVCGLALPPLICLTGYFGWRRFFPDAAERLRRRRSKALRVASRQLRRRDATTPARVRTIVADYLRLRADLPPGEPTPFEVRKALNAKDLNFALIGRAEEFFTDCDAVLFAPGFQARVDDPRAQARQLLQDLEAAICASAPK